MANFLDKTGLERFLGKIKSIFALKADTYTKGEIDNRIEEVASTTARAIYDIRNTIGANEELKIFFSGTENFQDFTSIADVIYYLDTEFVPRTELYLILDSVFNGSLYGSGDASGVAIGDFEETEQVNNEE